MRAKISVKLALKDIRIFKNIEAYRKITSSNSQTYAIIIETGYQLHNPERLETKIKHNDNKYGGK